MFMQAEEEYLRTIRPTTSTPSNAPSTPHHRFLAAPQQRPMYIPVWPAAQSGPTAPMHQCRQHPRNMSGATCSSHAPSCPASGTTSEHQLCPWRLGSDAQLLPRHPCNRIQSVTPWGPWPPYQQNYTGPYGHGDEDSETAKPNKFTGRDPSKLRPFVVSCIMAFDSWPRKFATDWQRLSYAASYLSDIAMLWWQPILGRIPRTVHSQRLG